MTGFYRARRHLVMIESSRHVHRLLCESFVKLAKTGALVSACETYLVTPRLPACPAL